MLKVTLLVAVSWMANARDVAGTITVRVDNVVGAPAGVIAKGEQEASFVFRWAGIAVQWVDCPAVDPRRTGNQVCVEPSATHTFTVVIADRFANTSIKDTALGFAMPFSGNRNYVGICYPQLKRVTDYNSELVDYGGLLGATMAHELAHLMLGSIRHGPGIMRANWTREEFKRISQRRLFFTAEQAGALRTGLRARCLALGPLVSNLMTAAPHK